MNPLYNKIAQVLALRFWSNLGSLVPEAGKIFY